MTGRVRARFSGGSKPVAPAETGLQARPFGRRFEARVVEPAEELAQSPFDQYTAGRKAVDRAAAREVSPVERIRTGSPDSGWPATLGTAPPTTVQRSPASRPVLQRRPLHRDELNKLWEDYEELDNLEDILSYLPSIHSFIRDEDFYEQLHEAVSFAEQILEEREVEDAELLDNLSRQVRHLRAIMKAALDERQFEDAEEEPEAGASGADVPEAEASEGEVAVSAALEEVGAKSTSARAGSASVATVEGGVVVPEGLTLLRGKKSDAPLAGQGKGGKRRDRPQRQQRRGTDITKEFLAQQKRFPDYFRPGEYAGARLLRTEVFAVDTHFAEKDGKTGYYTATYELIPAPSCKLGAKLFVHVHCDEQGRLRRGSPMKVIAEGDEALKDGSVEGSAKFKILGKAAAQKLGIQHW